MYSVALVRTVPLLSFVMLLLSEEVEGLGCGRKAGTAFLRAMILSFSFRR